MIVLPDDPVIVWGLFLAGFAYLMLGAAISGMLINTILNKRLALNLLLASILFLPIVFVFSILILIFEGCAYIVSTVWEKLDKTIWER